MPTNHTFAANCAATLGSAPGNFRAACQTKKICGCTRRGLAGVALATTCPIPLMRSGRIDCDLDRAPALRSDRAGALEHHVHQRLTEFAAGCRMYGMEAAKAASTRAWWRRRPKDCPALAH